MFRIILITGVIFTSILSKSQDKELGSLAKVNNLKVILFETLSEVPSFFLEEGGDLYRLSNVPSKSTFLKNDDFGIEIKNIPSIAFFYPNMHIKRIISWLEEEFLRKGIVMQSPLFIKAIYFDSNSELIRNDASVELDNLSRLILDHPNSKINITVYTDARGSVSNNQKLASRRAESTVKYLVKNGIDINQITTKTSQANILNNTIKGTPLSSKQIHKMNRRAEFSLSLDNTSLQ